MSGRFISFEGIDGSGKSTQIKLLKSYLESKSIAVELIREPGGTKLGEEIRELLLRQREEAMSSRAELLLYEASRAQLCEEFIAPKLKESTWILSDRFYDSSTAYQGGGRGLCVEEIKLLNAFAVDKTAPDISFLLDLDPALAYKRTALRHELDRLEAEGLEFMKKVRSSYLDLARTEPGRIKCIDASSSDPEAVFEQIKAHIAQYLN